MKFICPSCGESSEASEWNNKTMQRINAWGNDEASSVKPLEERQTHLISEGYKSADVWECPVCNKEVYNPVPEDPSNLEGEEKDINNKEIQKMNEQESRSKVKEKLFQIRRLIDEIENHLMNFD